MAFLKKSDFSKIFFKNHFCPDIIIFHQNQFFSKMRIILIKNMFPMFPRKVVFEAFKFILLNQQFYYKLQ